MNVSKEDADVVESIFFCPKVLDVGADALDLALDQVKSQAVEVVDKIDEDIQTKVTERAKASTKSLIRTTLFSLFPLLVLVGLQQLIQH